MKTIQTSKIMTNTKKIETEEILSEGVTHICCHRIEWWVRGEVEVTELDEVSFDHIQTLIIDGCWQGEVFITSYLADEDEGIECSGWWKIAK